MMERVDDSVLPQRAANAFQSSALRPFAINASQSRLMAALLPLPALPRGPEYPAFLAVPAVRIVACSAPKVPRVSCCGLKTCMADLYPFEIIECSQAYSPEDPLVLFDMEARTRYGYNT
jgi:hypothetical protein